MLLSAVKHKSSPVKTPVKTVTELFEPILKFCELLKAWWTCQAFWPRKIFWFISSFISVSLLNIFTIFECISTSNYACKSKFLMELFFAGQKYSLSSSCLSLNRLTKISSVNKSHISHKNCTTVPENLVSKVLVIELDVRNEFKWGSFDFISHCELYFWGSNESCKWRKTFESTETFFDFSSRRSSEIR